MIKFIFYHQKTFTVKQQFLKILLFNFFLYAAFLLSSISFYEKLTIEPDSSRYSVSNKIFKIVSVKDFGYFATKNKLYYFDSKNPNASSEITSGKPLIIDIRNWDGKNMDWQQTVPELSSKALIYEIHELKPDVDYSVMVYGKLIKKIKSNLNENLMISHIVSDVKERISIKNQD